MRCCSLNSVCDIAGGATVGAGEDAAAGAGPGAATGALGAAGAASGTGAAAGSTFRAAGFGAIAASSARLKSRIVAWRSAGLLASARTSTSFSSSGRAGFSSLGGHSGPRACPTITSSASPVKGSRAVSIS